MISSPYSWPDQSEARVAISSAPLRICCSQRSAEGPLSSSTGSAFSFIAVYLAMQGIWLGDSCQAKTPMIFASERRTPWMPGCEAWSSTTRCILEGQHLGLGGRGGHGDDRSC